MVISILVALNTETTAGCAGDCMTCHPKLKGDKDHKSLTTCITCHDPNKPKLKLSLNPSGADGCGDRCFLCHDKWPQDAYHADLGTCLNCHEK